MGVRPAVLCHLGSDGFGEDFRKTASVAQGDGLGVKIREVNALHFTDVGDE